MAEPMNILCEVAARTVINGKRVMGVAHGSVRYHGNGPVLTGVSFSLRMYDDYGNVYWKQASGSEREEVRDAVLLELMREKFRRIQAEGRQ